MRLHVIFIAVCYAAAAIPAQAQTTSMPAPEATTPSASSPAADVAAAPPPLPPMQDPPSVYTMCFTDGINCFTNADYVWSVGSTGKSINVPAGFVTDFASIPPGARDLFERQGPYSRAALIHDFLYWSQGCTRMQADNLFYIAMQESQVPWASRQTIYRVVQAGGGLAWKSNAADRTAGSGRVVPPGRESMANRMTWSAARAELKRSHVVDPPMRVDPAVCRLGDGTVVP